MRNFAWMVLSLYACIFVATQTIHIMERRSLHRCDFSRLYTSLIDISVRQNNKKLKYWFDTDQLEQIENLVKSASENAELKLTTKRDRLVSFTVMDTSNARKVFTGLFT